jgi:hypothetical protein
LVVHEKGAFWRADMRLLGIEGGGPWGYEHFCPNKDFAQRVTVFDQSPIVEEYDVTSVALRAPAQQRLPEPFCHTAPCLEAGTNGKSAFHP